MEEALAILTYFPSGAQSSIASSTAEADICRLNGSNLIDFLGAQGSMLASMLGCDSETMSERDADRASLLPLFLKILLLPTSTL
jgi:hypothetical protein